MLRLSLVTLVLILKRHKKPYYLHEWTNNTPISICQLYLSLINSKPLDRGEVTASY